MKVSTKSVNNAKKLINAGDVDLSSAWSFSGADGNKLLGENGDDWANYALWHLAEDTEAEVETKARYKYPYGKNGKVYRRAIIAIKSRAAQQEEEALVTKATELLDLIDSKNDVSHLCPECGAEMNKKECDECGYKKKKMQDSGEALRSVARVDMSIYSERWMTKPFQRTPEGFLKGRAIVTSIGVFQYADAEGVHGELRSPEEVFDLTSLESLKMKPLTNDHPKGVVVPDNIKEFGVGSVGSNVSYTNQRSEVNWNDEDKLTDGQHVSVDVVITDPDAIMDVLEGKRALSCGYTCDLELAPEGSVYLGMPYSYIQKNIRYNHVAIVDRARAGDAAKIRMDSADGAIHIDSTIPEEEEEEAMKTVKLDGVEYQAEAKVIESLTKETDRADSLQQEIEVLKKDKSTLEAERDTAKARADQLETELSKKSDKAAIQAAVIQRRKIERVAQDAGIEFKDDESDLDIQKKIITKAFPKLDTKDKDENYLAASYDAAVTTLESDANADTRQKVLEGNLDHADGEDKVDAAAARQRMMNNMQRKEA